MCTKKCDKLTLLRNNVALTAWNYPCKRSAIRFGYFNTFQRRKYTFRF